MTTVFIETENIISSVLINSLEAIFDNVYFGVTSATMEKNIITKYSLKIYLSPGNHDLDKDKHLFVDYLEICNDSDEIILQKANALYHNFHVRDAPRTPKVIVFDLDLTLIDKHGDFLCKHLVNRLFDFKCMFDYMVLWSHARNDWVESFISKLNKLSPNPLFNIIISRYHTTNECTNKGMGLVLKELNRLDRVTQLGYTCLVDDTVSNFSNDYLFFLIVPRKTVDFDLFYGDKIEKLRTVMAKADTVSLLKANERLI